MNTEAQLVFDRCSVKLLQIQPFYGSMLLGMDVKQSTKIPTMATDSITLWYNPDYVLKQREVIVVTDIAHEVGHKVYRDSLRRGARMMDKWNSACDFRINYGLKDAGFVLADDYLYDPKFKGMDAEEIYNLLRDNPDDPANKQAEDKGGCGCGGLQDAPSKGKGKPEEGKGEGEGQGAGEDFGIPDVDFGEAETLMSIAQARNFAKKQGNMPGALDEAIEAILNPQMNWGQILQVFMENCCQDDFSWQVPDRRFLGRGVYLPGMESEAINSLVVCADTSGSTRRFIPRFLGAINQITGALKFKELIVMYCDRKVQHVDKFTQHDLPIATDKTYGGGGTAFQPAFDWLEDHAIQPTGMVYMTDLDGPEPTVPDFPVLWVVPKGLGLAAPWGDVVEMEV